MIFTKEVMNNPDVQRFSEVREEDDVLYVEDLKATGAWMLAALMVALEAPHNAEWHREFLEKQDRKQFAPSQLPED